MTKKDLDQVVLNIEFLVVSVVQGVALAALATSAIGPINNFQIEYWPYIISGFILILIFWSGVIIHALSFIDWPIDLKHSFFYFLASFVEVVLFSDITNPTKWFLLSAVFFGVAQILYQIDLKLIENHKKMFETIKSKKPLYQHILSQQLFEMRFIVPAGFIFSCAATALLYLYPTFFIVQQMHGLLIGIQIIFLLVFLKNLSNSFAKRSALITATIED